MFLQGLENADAQNPNTLKTPSCELRGHEGELLAKLFFYPSASIKAFFCPECPALYEVRNFNLKHISKCMPHPGKFTCNVPLATKSVLEEVQVLLDLCKYKKCVPA